LWVKSHPRHAGMILAMLELMQKPEAKYVHFL
jgi:hypothetical protein